MDLDQIISHGDVGHIPALLAEGEIDAALDLLLDLYYVRSKNHGERVAMFECLNTIPLNIDVVTSCLILLRHENREYGGCGQLIDTFIGKLHCLNPIRALAILSDLGISAKS